MSISRNKLAKSRPKPAGKPQPTSKQSVSGKRISSANPPPTVRNLGAAAFYDSDFDGAYAAVVNTAAATRGNGHFRRDGAHGATRGAHATTTAAREEVRADGFGAGIL